MWLGQYYGKVWCEQHRNLHTHAYTDTYTYIHTHMKIHIDIYIYTYRYIYIHTIHSCMLTDVSLTTQTNFFYFFFL